MTSRKCFFKKDWLDSSLNPSWVSWLRENPDRNKATCVLCNVAFSLSNMGRQAVVSHGNGSIHKKRLEETKKLRSVTSLFPSKISNSAGM